MALTQLTQLTGQSGISTTIDYKMSDLVVDTISVGGTITYNDVTSVDSIGIITARKGIQVLADGLNVTGVSTLTGNTSITGIVTATEGVKIPDGKNLTLGTDGDVGIKHQSGHFEINNTTGNTYFQTNGQIRLRAKNSGSTEEMIIATAGGSVDLYHDN